jgi:hypothetical protein
LVEGWKELTGKLKHPGTDADCKGGVAVKWGSWVYTHIKLFPREYPEAWRRKKHICLMISIKK